MLFKDRADAGRQLAEKLLKYREEAPIIIALPRGGVVTGYEIAKALKAPLDVIVTRKLGAPFQPEFGIGAIAQGNIKIIDNKSVSLLKISAEDIEKIIQREKIEMDRRNELYRRNAPQLDLHSKTVIVVDDGLATGATAMAAVSAIKLMNPKKLILAVPVSPPYTGNKFRMEIDKFVCLYEPFDFYAVGAYYEDFRQVTDEEVIKLLKEAKTYE